MSTSALGGPTHPYTRCLLLLLLVLQLLAQHWLGYCVVSLYLLPVLIQLALMTWAMAYRDKWIPRTNPYETPDWVPLNCHTHNCFKKKMFRLDAQLHKDPMDARGHRSLRLSPPRSQRY